jgi:hypothetical protein
VALFGTSNNNNNSAIGNACTNDEKTNDKKTFDPFLSKPTPPPPSSSTPHLQTKQSVFIWLIIGLIIICIDVGIVGYVVNNAKNSSANVPSIRSLSPTIVPTMDAPLTIACNSLMITDFSLCQKEMSFIDDNQSLWLY